MLASSLTNSRCHAPCLRWLPALLLSCSFTSLPGTLGAQSTFYVNKSSSNCADSPTAGTQANPFCSIQYAVMEKASPNVTIIVEAASTPYAEAVRIRASDGSYGQSGQPFVLKTTGGAIIDGAQLISGWTERPIAVDSPNKVWTAYAPQEGTNDISQVHLNDVRYPQGDYLTLAAIPTGYCDWSPSSAPGDTVFVNFGAGNYQSTPGYISKRPPLSVLTSDYVTIEGFTILRSHDNGIEINGPNTPLQTNCIVRGCTVKYSAAAGIEVSDATNTTISDNSVSHNTAPGIRINTDATSCSILRNTVFLNAHPVDPVIKVQGMRIGNGGTPASGSHLVEANKAYSNSDTGIEVNASDYNTLRYNQSWLNTDHGFDHINADNTTHVGNLAYGNGRSGFSVESSSGYTTIKNCVMADNGRSVTDKNYELEVLEAAHSTFVGDYNVIYRPSRSETAGCSHGEEADTILVCLTNTTSSAECTQNCTQSGGCFGTVLRYATDASVNPNGNESHSKQGNPSFVDGANGNFQLQSGSAAIDAASAGGSGWVATDVRGFVRHDYAGKDNSGTGTPDFADIGPYEFDIAPGAPAIAVCWQQFGAEVTWTARGDDGDIGTPGLYEVIANGQVMSSGTPAAPGSPEAVAIGLQGCTAYTIKVRMTDLNNNQTAESNSESGSTACDTPPPCGINFGGGGGEGSGSRVAREEVLDFPLELARPHPSPSRGVSTVSWSVPRAQVGVPFELALFDIAGRKMASLSKGTAEAGRFTREVSFRSEEGHALANGVFFIRLRIGAHSILRTVILSR